MRLRRIRTKPHRVNPFKRALIIGPFQMPIIAYLLYVGTLYILLAPTLAKEAGLHEVWPVYNFAALLVIGSIISLTGRLRGNERWEAWGLSFLVVGLGEATWLELSLGMYLGLADNIALMAGCGTRMWVISRARKAQRMMNDMVVNSDDPEGN